MEDHKGLMEMTDAVLVRIAGPAKDELERVATQLGVPLSAAARVLILKGVEAMRQEA